MSIIEIIKWTGVVTAVIGQVLINRKLISAYYVWIISCILMVIATYFIADWPFFSLYIVYLGLNIDGLRRWKKG